MQPKLKRELSGYNESTDQDTLKARRASRYLVTKGSSVSSMHSKIDDDFDRNEEKFMGELRILDNPVTQKVAASKLDIQFDNHAEQKYKCMCNICKEESLKKKEKVDNRPEAAFFLGFDFEAHRNSDTIEKDFVFVLKRLIPPKNITNTLRISVPDTACFMQGECRFIAFTGKDKTLKFIKQKDKLVLHELRKYFEERRRKRDDEFFVNGREDSLSPKAQESKDLTKIEVFTEGVTTPAASVTRSPVIK